MNPTQAAVRQTIFSSPVKPRVIDAKVYTNTTTPLTITIPRSPRKLCVAVLWANGSGTAPATPTGFTSLATQNHTASNAWGSRICYKFLDGSEAATLTSAATGATRMIGHVFLIDGAISTRVPTVSTVVNSVSSPTADPGAVTVTAPVTQTLVIVAVAFGSGLTPSVTGLPVGFTRENSLETNDLTNNMQAVSAWMNGFCVSSYDPTAVSLSANSTVSSYAIAVRGA